MNTSKKTPSSAPTVADRTFLREVDDALHQERMAYYWQQYRSVIVAGVAALVAATAAWQGWQAYQRHRTLSLAEQYYAWTTETDPKTREAKFADLLSNSRDGYRALLVFSQATEAGKTDPKAADRAYGQIYNDAAQPQWLREIARLNAALDLLGREDTLAQEHLSILVQNSGGSNLTTSPGPVYPIALELLALLAQRRGDLTTARGYTERLLALQDISPDLRQRALARLGQLSTLAR